MSQGSHRVCNARDFLVYHNLSSSFIQLPEGLQERGLRRNDEITVGSSQS